jgi:hypothetical protein
VILAVVGIVNLKNPKTGKDVFLISSQNIRRYSLYAFIYNLMAVPQTQSQVR